VFRGHYFAEKTLLAMNLPVTIAPHAIDSCALLSIVDVLVSDYSSIFYDFLVTGRPVIHHVPDWDYYVETRGTYFGREALPGIVTETHEELRAALAACIADPKEHISDVYRDARARYCRMEDGQACRRVIEALFFDDCVPVQPVLPKGAGSILLHCGTLDDTPLTRSCRALTGVLRQMGHAVTLIVDRRHLIDNEPRTRAAQDMLDRADVLIRFGRACMTPEEAWINTRFDSPLFDPNAAMSEVFDCALAHEVRRLFGCARFDAVADLEGQRPFWRNILSATPARSRAIRLTGAQVGTPGAAADVALVTRRFDLHDREMVDAALAEQYGRVPVCVDAPTVLAHADVPSEVAGQDGDLAAMSKDQRRKVILPCPVANDATLAPMIEALRLLIEADHDPVLYVLGRLADPVGLRDWLQAADCLGRVVLLGEKPSSFPFLKAGECLVLLSPREVQGVALPEALTLGVPCVVVGDADTQDLLADNRGVLVGPDPESLAVGVALVLEGRFTPRPLDPEAYNRSVAQSFLATLGLAGGAR
jgi:CDP-glycerol glycerophosphotransferase